MHWFQFLYKALRLTIFSKITNLVVLNPALQTDIEQAISEFESTINSSLPNIDSAELTRDTVNSNIISNKGLGVDYTNSMKSFMIGWSQGASVNLGSGENILSGANTVKGFGMATQFNLGLNFAPLKKKKTYKPTKTLGCRPQSDKTLSRIHERWHKSKSQWLHSWF